ncbi:prolipoprotein diacylglyceryl transferase [Gordonia sp. NPDC003425]
MLAYIPSPPQGVWYLGPVPIRAYALCIIVGIIVAVWWGNRRWVARGGQPGEVLDVAIWAVPFGLVGGRLYHVLTDWQIYFGDGGKTPIEALYVWDGGLGIWGAVILGGVGAWIGARQRGIKLPPFADAIAPPILLSQAIGRLGNYFNQELYGRPTNLPWGLEIYDRVDAQGIVGPSQITGHSTGNVVAVVHPTFLYEMLWNIAVVIVLVLVDRHFRIGHGRLFALYVSGYCAGRFAIELMRSDPAFTHIAGVRINVFTAALLFVCGAVYFIVAPKGRETGLEVYHRERAEELEALGMTGYQPDSDLDRDEPVRTASADENSADESSDDENSDDEITDDGVDIDTDQSDEEEPVSESEQAHSEAKGPEVTDAEPDDSDIVEGTGESADATAWTPGAEQEGEVAESELLADTDDASTVASDEPETAAEDAEGVTEVIEDEAVDEGDTDAAGVDEDEPELADGQATEAGGPVEVTDADPDDSDIVEGTDESADATAWTPGAEQEGEVAESELLADTDDASTVASDEPETAAEDAEGVTEVIEDEAVDEGDTDAAGVDEDEPELADGQATEAGGPVDVLDTDPDDSDIVEGTGESADATAWTPRGEAPKHDS